MLVCYGRGRGVLLGADDLHFRPVSPIARRACVQQTKTVCVYGCGCVSVQQIRVELLEITEIGAPDGQHP